MTEPADSLNPRNLRDVDSRRGSGCHAPMAARTPLPTPEKIRMMITDPKVTPADLDQAGDLFLEAGHPSTAAMLYERAKSPERIRRILDQALKDGDAFLLDWVVKVAPDLA